MPRRAGAGRVPHRCPRGTATMFAAVVAVAALGACTNQSRVNRNATVHVVGTATAVGGGPLADRPVKLGSGVPAGDAAIGVFTFGLGCATGVCAGTVKTTKTDASGAYDITLSGGETQSSFGEAKSELLTVTAAPSGQQISGASASARFRIQTERVTLPPLALVDPQTRLSSAADGHVLTTWSTTSPPADRLTFSNRDGQAVWDVPASGQRAQLDGRVLEDTTGRVTLSGGSTSRIEGSDLTLRWTGPGLAYASGAGAPASRGASCTYTHANAPVPTSGGTCELTDGDLVTPVSLPPVCAAGVAAGSSAAPPCPSADAVNVVLPQAVPAQLVVVRGCAATCNVATSANGTTFERAGVVTGAFGTVTLTGTAIRAVRVTSPGALREVSVWGPAKAPALATVTTKQTKDLRAPFVGSHASTRRHVVIAVAAVLLAVVLLGLGFALGRRRRA